MTKIDHAAFPQPERSELRKMSANTVMTSHIHRKNRKNHNIDQNTCPVPNAVASIELSLAVGKEVSGLRMPLSPPSPAGASPPPGDAARDRRPADPRLKTTSSDQPLPSGGRPCSLLATSLPRIRVAQLRPRTPTDRAPR